MKSSDQDLQPSSPKTPGEIGGARKLVGLDTHKRNNRPAAGKLVGPDDPVDGYSLDRIVENPDFYFEVAAKGLAALKVLSKTAEAGKRVARQDTA
jgi:hypothetical protein